MDLTGLLTLGTLIGMAVVFGWMAVRSERKYRAHRELLSRLMATSTQAHRTSDRLPGARITATTSQDEEAA